MPANNALPQELDLDISLLRDAIKGEYKAVANEPQQGFHFHTGLKLARILEYPQELIDSVPERALESFAGTGNPFRMEKLKPGEKVVDMGCGAGFDSFIAARMVGPDGQVIGVDMTPEMLEKAQNSLQSPSVSNIEFRLGYAEELPVSDNWADVVISNGVLNLTPDKSATLRQLNRVLKPGGCLKFADIMVEKPVPHEAKEEIDLWTG
ncbi:methyltransferase domain-containing protein [candidate division KSB1 bacterium]|nr:methyltransferase domain-containing protein [candidate division KSB1 bacterium]